MGGSQSAVCIATIYSKMTDEGISHPHIYFFIRASVFKLRSFAKQSQLHRARLLSYFGKGNKPRNPQILAWGAHKFPSNQTIMPLG